MRMTKKYTFKGLGVKFIMIRTQVLNKTNAPKNFWGREKGVLPGNIT